jgi:hypothetical protein
MKNRVRHSNLLLLVAMIVGFTQQACSPGTSNKPAVNSTLAQPTQQPAPRTAFERDLQFIRSGQFKYIWGFSRADGKPLDKNDAAYLRANAPQVVDWVTTEEGKRVIAGTNFDLEQGSLPLLRKRFVVDDYTGK